LLGEFFKVVAGGFRVNFEGFGDVGNCYGAVGVHVADKFSLVKLAFSH
jgi:hypothetical protein